MITTTSVHGGPGGQAPARRQDAGPTPAGGAGRFSPGMRIVADLHVHTRHSHGSGELEDVVAAARRRGLAAIAVTEHGPGSAPWIAVSPARLRWIGDELRRLGQRYPDIRVLWGVEANLIGSDGRIDVSDDLIQELDLLAVGYHPDLIPPSCDAWRLIGRNWFSRRWPGNRLSGLRAAARAANTAALIAAVERYPVAFISHPGHRVDIDTAALAAACARRGTALEINAGHGHMSVEFCQTARAAGARFVIGSDAHRPADVGRFGPALRVAGLAGLTAGDVVNAATQAESSPGRPGQEPTRIERILEGRETSGFKRSQGVAGSNRKG